jgi:hypothetical protein
MKIDGVSPSVQPNVAVSSAAQAPLQNVKAGIWASSPGSSTSTHKTRDDPNEKQAKALVRWAMKASKREPASLPTKLAEAFLGANPAVREAIRKNSAYQGIIAKWAREVGDALNGPRTTIHPGDQGMHKLHDLAIGLPPDLAQDLVVAATPVFVNGNGAIFSSNDKVPVSDLSPTLKRQSRALTMRHQSRALMSELHSRLLTLKGQRRTLTMKRQSRALTVKLRRRNIRTTPISMI